MTMNLPKTKFCLNGEEKNHYQKLFSDLHVFFRACMCFHSYLSSFHTKYVDTHIFLNAHTKTQTHENLMKGKKKLNTAYLLWS